MLRGDARPSQWRGLAEAGNCRGRAGEPASVVRGLMRRVQTRGSEAGASSLPDEPDALSSGAVKARTTAEHTGGSCNRGNVRDTSEQVHGRNQTVESATHENLPTSSLSR